MLGKGLRSAARHLALRRALTDVGNLCISLELPPLQSSRWAEFYGGRRRRRCGGGERGARRKRCLGVQEHRDVRMIGGAASKVPPAAAVELMVPRSSSVMLHPPRRRHPLRTPMAYETTRTTPLENRIALRATVRLSTVRKRLAERERETWSPPALLQPSVEEKIADSVLPEAGITATSTQNPDLLAPTYVRTRVHVYIHMSYSSTRTRVFAQSHYD
jgi:hypothetical protein